MKNRIKFEQMIEYLINENKEKAEEVFHDLVVATSREIYENLLSDELNEIGGDETDDFINDVEAPEDDMDMDTDTEFSDEFNDESSDESETEFEFNDQDDEDISNRDVLDALEDLKAEFEQFMSQDKGDDFESEDEFDTEFSDEPESEEDSEEEPADIESDEEGEDFDEAFVREYVEKVSAGHGVEKKGVGETSGVNTKSPVAKKNDMGGTTANIARGGSGSDKGTSGGLASNKPQDMKTGNVNVPGGKAGKSGFTHKESGHGAEKKGSAESKVSATSIIGSKN